MGPDGGGIAGLPRAFPLSVRNARFSFQFLHFIFIASTLAFSLTIQLTHIGPDGEIG
jgi:hypothetical protein